MPPGRPFSQPIPPERAVTASPRSGDGRHPADEAAGQRAFLESGRAWAGEPPPDCIETHASLVFLGRDRAWKMKKPVRLRHLDLTTLAARERSCREELRINRELAGREVYLGLVPLTRDTGGRFALGGAGEVVDWLLEMRRLPEAQLLDRRLAHGPPPRAEEIESVADTLLRFYGRASVDRAVALRYPARLLRDARVNAAHLDALRDRLGAPLDPGLPSRAVTRLERGASEMTARAGVLADGHGDLRPEHVCLVRPPVIFDRLDFDPEMRVLDPYDEFDQLGLECLRAGAGWIRAVLLARLRDAGVPPPSPDLLATWGIQYCLTRARLALDHLRPDEPPRTPERWPAEARSQLALAARIEAEGPPAGS